MTAYYPIIAILLLWLAAWTDLTRRIIRNWISIALLLLFVLYAFFTALPIDVAGHVLWAMGLFAVMFIGFFFGKVGGSDVKLATYIRHLCPMVSRSQLAAPLRFIRPI